MTNPKRNVEDADVVERLRQTFRDSKKSQQELADILGCSRSYVGNIMSERALLSGRVMRKLLDQGYDIHWILSGTSQSEEIQKLQEKIDTVKELLKEAYKN